MELVFNQHLYPSTDLKLVQFLLFTRSNPDDEQILSIGEPKSIIESNFNPDLPTKVIIHGWVGKGTSWWILQMKDVYLEQGLFLKSNLFTLETFNLFQEISISFL